MLTHVAIYLVVGLLFGEIALIGERFPGGVPIDLSKYLIIACMWPLVVLVIAAGVMRRILR